MLGKYVEEVQEPGFLNADQEKFSSLDWTDIEEEGKNQGEAEARKQCSDSDDEVLAKRIVRMKYKNVIEEEK